MVRGFNTHKIRKQKELTSCIWDFSPCQGENAGKVYKVVTPCCFESHPVFAGYRGEGEYSVTFRAKGNIRLEFKGVSHTATVFLDGKEVASHYNAYTIFDAVINDLEEGEHTLVVRADNRFSEKSALHVPNDYMSYGGISRPVVLEELQSAYIKWIHITPFMQQGKWQALIELCVKNIEDKDIELAVQAEVAGKLTDWGATKIDKKSEVILQSTLEFDNINLWTMDSPELYKATGYLFKDGKAIDDYIDRFGFREIKIEGKHILLNGERIKIKGLCRHEDHPQYGCALPYAAMAADLEIIRHLGANSVRTAHYPNDELFLDLCDELGILVWEENHARGLSEQDMKNPNFEWQAEQVIQEMITAHYNHPSIYIWGILNECASDSEYGRECYQKQFNLVKKLDSSRPHSFASCKFKTDICFGLPDIVSYNIYPLWYHNTPPDEYLDDLYQWVQNETDGAGKPFIITETGAGGLYGYHNPYNSKWTEEYQAETLEKQLKAVLSYKDCAGIYIWQFCDIRVSDEWFGVRPRTMNNKGVVDEYRRPKMAYNVVKRIFEEY